MPTQHDERTADVAVVVSQTLTYHKLHNCRKNQSHNYRNVEKTIGFGIDNLIEKTR
jgi:hypothetical protein